MSKKTDFHVPSHTNKYAFGKAWNSEGIPLPAPFTCVYIHRHVHVC